MTNAKKPRVPRKKKPTKRDPNRLYLLAGDDEDERLAHARLTRRPTVQAAATLKEFDGTKFPGLDVTAMVEALVEQTDAALAGDTTRGQAMLVAQAHTLDTIFNTLARRAIHAEYMDHLEPYLKLALRAQSQCRATWEALSAIQNPPVAGYVRQANIAHGPQQVNNGVTASEPSRTGETESPPNQLLEKTDGERLDTGTTGTTSGADTSLEAVGAVDGADDSGG